MKLLLEKSSLKLIHMHISSWAWALTQSECECRWERLLVPLVAAVEGLWELPDERKNDGSLCICENLGDCHKQATQRLSFVLEARQKWLCGCGAVCMFSVVDLAHVNNSAEISNWSARGKWRQLKAPIWTSLESEIKYNISTVAI